MVLMHLVGEYVVFKVSGIASNTWFLLGLVKILFREKYIKFVHAVISRGWGLCVWHNHKIIVIVKPFLSQLFYILYISFQVPYYPTVRKLCIFIMRSINLQKFKNHKRVIWIKSCSRFEHLTYPWIHFHQSCFCF